MYRVAMPLTERTASMRKLDTSGPIRTHTQHKLPRSPHSLTDHSALSSEYRNAQMHG